MVDLRVIDWVLALLLTAGALVDASSQLRHGLDALRSLRWSSSRAALRGDAGIRFSRRSWR
jgi:hypothetical protein